MKNHTCHLVATLILLVLTTRQGRAQSTYEPYTFTTLAGPPFASPGSIDGTGSAARFHYPQGLAVDSAGNAYVADTGNNTLRKVTPTGVVTTLAGLAGNEGSADGTGNAAQFFGPQGVAVDSAGNVYVADQHNSTIRKVTPAGVVTTLAGLAAQYDASGNIISGGAGSSDGTGSAARFDYPQGLAVDSASNVYVADYGNNTVRKVTPTGVVTTLAGQAGVAGSADGTGSAAQFFGPQGVTVDSGGNVYVADAGNNTIRKVTPAGVVTTVAGLAGNFGSADGTGSAARFHYPQGLAVESAGNIYVTDTGNNTIRKVTAAGVVTTVAGLAGNYGSADGTGSAARFDYPRGLAVDSASNVYVADTGNGTIRRVTPAGVVTTLAGRAAQYDASGNIISGGAGSADRTGSAARFYYPQGLAVDSASNVYVADTGNGTIRRVTPAGVVTTLAGLAGSAGSVDGTGNAARFGGFVFSWSGGIPNQAPSGIAVDSAGNLYVTDSFNNTIRKGYPALFVLNSGPGFGFSAGQFGFNLTGPAGQAVVVEASADLVSWLPIWTNTSTLRFTDPQSGASSHRFYRARTP